MTGPGLVTQNDADALVFALTRQGFDYANGDVLMMPSALEASFKQVLLPPYVRFSPLVTQPVVMRGTRIY